MSSGWSAITWAHRAWCSTETGSVAGIKRHDYLPFGEELQSQQGLRTAALGFSGGDGVHQQFTSKERDIETNLDYFGAVLLVDSGALYFT